MRFIWFNQQLRGLLFARETTAPDSRFKGSISEQDLHQWYVFMLLIAYLASATMKLIELPTEHCKFLGDNIERQA